MHWNRKPEIEPWRPEAHGCVQQVLIPLIRGALSPSGTVDSTVLWTQKSAQTTKSSVRPHKLLKAMVWLTRCRSKLALDLLLSKARDLCLARWHHTPSWVYKRDSHLNMGRGVFVYEVETLLFDSIRMRRDFLKTDQKKKKKVCLKIASLQPLRGFNQRYHINPWSL